MKLAILNQDNIIENIINVENFEFSKNFSDKICIIISENHQAEIGWLSDGKYAIPPKPFDSWIWNSETGYWDAPKNMPNNTSGWKWLEDLQEWEEIEPESVLLKPYDSWIWNAKFFRWDPPVSYPDNNKIYEWNEDLISWVEVE